MVSWESYYDWRREDYHTVVGDVRIMERVWSPQLKNRRNLLVYLPPSYAEEKARRYPVVYMHDGQNLFDQRTAFDQEWRVDETMERLSRDGLEAIVVGIPNTGGQRLAEYSPFDDNYHGKGRGHLYLSFLLETVKPMIDRDFRTLPGREHTGTIGSSMGGLISLYAFFSHGDVFSFAGAMSPSLWFAGSSMFRYVKHAPYVDGRLYLDVGTRELGGSRADREARSRSRRYYASVRRLQRLLVKKGYRPRRNLLVVEEKWAGHNEPAWAGRLPAALRFLLPELS